MKSDVYKYVQSCDKCQSKKSARRKPYGSYCPIPIPGTPRRHWQIDMVGPFPRSNHGNVLILTAEDYLSKYVELKAVSSGTAEQVASFVLQQIIGNHGCPEIIQSDRGANFTGEVFQNLMKKLGINHHLSTPGHPQSQGSLERTHSYLKAAISMYVSDHQRNWDQFIPVVKLAINSNVQESIRMSPFKVQHGQEPLLPAETQLPRIESSPVADHDLHFHSIYEEVVKNLKIAREKLEKTVLSRHQQHKFIPGDLVLYHRPSRRQGTNPALAFPFAGPYKILQQLNEVNYIVADIRDSSKKETVHVSKLKKYYSRETPVTENSVPEPATDSTVPPVPPNSPVPAENPGANPMRRGRSRLVTQSHEPATDVVPQQTRYNLRSRRSE